jgi:hypothetical protein
VAQESKAENWVNSKTYALSWARLFLPFMARS